MIYPPIFAACSADAAVQALLGTSPCRLYPFGQSEGLHGGPPVKPYAVWQVAGGIPENYLGTLPDADNWTVQIDVYADSADAARTVAVALRDAIEPVAYVTSWRGESREPNTNHYRSSFDVGWITRREAGN